MTGRAGGSAAAGAMEVILNPAVVGCSHAFERISHQHALFRQHGDPVADRVQRVQVMGDQEYAEAEGVAQGENQLVEGCRSYGVQTGGGLVEKEDVRIQRQCPGQSSALDHAAGKLRGKLAPCVGRQASQGQLHAGQVLGVIATEAGMLDQRQGNVLGDGQRGEQRAALEQHTEAPFDLRAALFIKLVQLLAEHPDTAAIGAAQSDDGAQQDRLAGTRATHHAQDFPRSDVQIQILVHGLLAEAVDQPADLHQGFAFVAHQSISMKNSAASASSSITTKMDWTTAEVVCSPTDSALPLTLKPSMQPMMAIRKANSGALAIPR